MDLEQSPVEMRFGARKVARTYGMMRYVWLRCLFWAQQRPGQTCTIQAPSFRVEVTYLPEIHL